MNVPAALKLEEAEMAHEGPPKTIPILLLGCGGVGQVLLCSLLASRQQYAAKGLHLAVLGVCDSNVAAFGQPGDELDDTSLRHLVSLKAANLPLNFGLKTEQVQAHGSRIRFSDLQIEELGEPHGLGVVVVVDCTASDKTGNFLAEAISRRCCVVLANKKPISSSLELYDKIASARRRFRCESTVGAGLPIICTLTRLVAAGDRVHRIVGALSGTLGYVMSELQKGRLLSEVVKTAKALGYTEPDPRDDLSGTDVARKAVIMARSVGWHISMEDVQVLPQSQVESLYPEGLGPDKMATKDFLEFGVNSLDKNMQALVETAALAGRVLRYIAIVSENSCQVGLSEVDENTPLGHLSGSNNLVEIHSNCYSPSPLVIQGAGAGNLTTAAGVLADVIDLQDLF